MRVTPAEGRAIIRGTLGARLYTTRNAPYRSGQTTALEYPQTLTDSYGEPIRTLEGTPRVQYGTMTALRIDAVRHDTLEAIERFTANQLGHDTIEAFREAFDLEHNHCFDPETDGPKRTRAFNPDREVWVVYFTPQHLEKLHILPKLPREPEAIDPAIALPASETAHRRWHHARRQEAERRERMPLTQQIDMALREAHAAGISTDQAEWAIRRQLAKLERAVKGEAA